MLARPALFAYVGCITLLLPACGSEEKPIENDARVPLADAYRKLGDRLGPVTDELKGSATTSGQGKPVDLGSVATLPRAATGDVDTAAEFEGMFGVRSLDVDGAGEKEPVAIFVPRPSADDAASSPPSFVAWKGDAESADEGMCYLGWIQGDSWFFTSKCRDTSGAWVCRVTNGEASCSACNSAGACKPCDMSSTSFTCTW